MNLFLTTLVSTLLFVGSNAVNIRYPNSTNPCIMLDMEANITLTVSGTKNEKTDSVLEEGAMGTGTCAKGQDTMSTVDVVLNTGVKGILNFQFSKGTDSKVKMDISLTFTPDNVFKNGDNTPAVLSDVGSTQMGSDVFSYTCSGQKMITFNKVNSSDNANQYQLTMNIGSMHIQAFNVDGTTFSNAVDCSAIDETSSPAPGVTSEAPTSVKPAEPTTVPTPNNGTSEAPVTNPPSNETSTVPPTVPPSNDTTTMPPKNDTTTEPPVNPTTQPTDVTTVPQPTPPPTPKPGSPATVTYRVKGENDTTCILMKAGIEFVIPYVATGGKNVTKTIGIDALNMNETKMEGSCTASNVTQTLMVTFYETSMMTMTFMADKDNYYVSQIDLTIDLNDDLFPDAAKKEKKSISQTFKSGQFEASKSGSYKCNDDSTLTLTNGFEMHTYNLQYTAFQKDIKDFTDDSITECPGDDDTNSVVPIAVGAALAGLVVIVLIAYLIGRKRSRQSGYEQV